MAERRKRGLGRGLGALIPDAASNDRPVDVFFSGGEREEAYEGTDEPKTQRAARTDPAASMQSSRRRKPQSASSTANNSKQDAAGSNSSAAQSTEAKGTAAKNRPTKSTAATGAAAKGAAAKSEPAKTASANEPVTGTAAKSGRSQTAKKEAAASAEPAKPKPTGETSDLSKTTPATATGVKKAEVSKDPAKKKSTAGTTRASEPVATPSAASETAASKTGTPKTATPKTGTAQEASDTSPADRTDVTAEKAVSELNPGQDSPFGDADSASTSESVETSAESELGKAEESKKSLHVAAEAETVGDSSELYASRLEEDGSDSDTEYGDDVSETHPGVFTSGREVFDESRLYDAADSSATTSEVNKHSESPDESSNSGTGADDTTSQRESDLEGVDSIPDTQFGEIDVDRIDANPRQPRTFFDEDQLSELVHSIREIGVLQPVVVRPKPGDSERFELIMGERRLRATKDAGLANIPAIIRYVDDTDLLRDALLENLHRAELNPLEEAAAYGQLLEDFGCTQEELSERIGRSRPQISNTLRLLRLPPLVQRRVAAGVISAGHARAILGLRDAEHMEVLAQRIVAEGLSVRASEEAVVLLNRGDSMNVSRATTRVSPQFIEVAERLGDRLDTKVNITVGKKKGKLSVEFANQDDLDRILNLLGVESPDE